MILRKEPFGGILFTESNRKISLLSKNSFSVVESFFVRGVQNYEEIINKVQLDNSTIYEVNQKKRMVDFIVKVKSQADADGGLKYRSQRIDSSIWDKEWDGLSYGAPLSVFWTFTMTCNLHCTHCAWSSGQPLENELSLEECYNAIDQLDEMGVMEISFSGGEPLAKKDMLFKMADYARAKGFKLGLATNATLIDQQMADRLIGAGFKEIHVSFEGNESLKSIRGKDTLEKVLRGTKILVDSGVVTCFNVSINKTTMTELDSIAAQAIASHVNFIRFVRFVPIGRGKEHANVFDMSPEMEYNTAVKINDIRVKYLGKLPVTTNRMYRVLGANGTSGADKERNIQMHNNFPVDWDCAAGRDRICIMPQGGVAPCPLMGSLGITGGNLRDRALTSIWDSSSLFRKVRTGKRLLNDNCKECGKWELCRGGCKAASHAHHSDLFLPDPLCSYIKNIIH